MAANTTPIFVITPHVGMVRIATANTGRDGTGTLNSIITGTTNGTRVDRVTIKAQGTTTAGMVRFYIDDGTNIRFWREELVSAITPGANTKSFEVTITSPDPQTPLLVLPLNYILKCAPHNAETFDVIGQGGDF